MDEEQNTVLGLGEKVEAAIEQWMRNHIYNSAVSQSEDAINHVRASLGHLKDEVLKAVE